MLYQAVVKLPVNPAARLPPAPALAPAADCVPAEPLGMLTVTVVSSGKPVAGVKVAVRPSTFHEPATEGETLGSAEPAARGAEKPT